MSKGQPLTACPVPHRGGVSMQKSKQHLSKELSDCVVYCKSVHFSGFKHSRLHQKFYEVSSFTESKARKQLRDAGKATVTLTVYSYSLQLQFTETVYSKHLRDAGKATVTVTVYVYRDSLQLPFTVTVYSCSLQLQFTAST